MTWKALDPVMLPAVLKLVKSLKGASNPNEGLCRLQTQREGAGSKILHNVGQTISGKYPRAHSSLK
eukprot:4082486-Amphidinium_carterae.1